MAGWTNRGAYEVVGTIRGETDSTGYTLYALNGTPDADDNVFTDLTEASNYDGEQSISKNSTDFDTWTEDDASDVAYLQLKDIVVTASGGTCTTTASALLDNNGTENSREILWYWAYGATQNIPDGSTLTLVDLQISISAA